MIFIEAIPEISQILKQKTACLKKSVALNYLVTDKDDEMYDFKVSNNRGGMSSSIYDLKDHNKVCGNVCMVRTIKLKSITLPTMLQRENLNIDDYDSLVMDTQGSEFLVLKGAQQIINKFKYIVTEVADFESYAGCGQLKDIEPFMQANNFEEHYRQIQRSTVGIGSYWDIVYRRKSCP
jgi:FkbM family methyltransferase